MDKYKKSVSAQESSQGKKLQSEYCFRVLVFATLMLFITVACV